MEHIEEYYKEETRDLVGGIELRIYTLIRCKSLINGSQTFSILHEKRTKHFKNINAFHIRCQMLLYFFCFHIWTNEEEIGFNLVKANIGI